MLQCLWDSRASRIEFHHHFDDFMTPAR
ncbi:hypothetical protein [Brevibacterium koreense]